jgi:hypothetical protein
MPGSFFVGLPGFFMAGLILMTIEHSQRIHPHRALVFPAHELRGTLQMLAHELCAGTLPWP